MSADDMKMTAEQFDRFLPALRRFSQGSVELLRAVLVDGLSASDAVEQFGVSRQNVSRLLIEVRKIRASVPRDWVFFQEFMPAEMAERVRQEIVVVRAEHDMTVPIQRSALKGDSNE